MSRDNKDEARRAEYRVGDAVVNLHYAATSAERLVEDSQPDLEAKRGWAREGGPPTPELLAAWGAARDAVKAALVAAEAAATAVSKAADLT